MRIEHTHDMNIVTHIMAHPSIYPYVSDDGCPDAEDYEAIDNEALYYLLVLDNDENVLGLFLIHPHNTILYEIHTCLLSSCREKDKAAQVVLDWIFKNTPCEKLMTHVPDFNRPALLYAERAGLMREGINRLSFLKNGRLHDQILLGITRTEQCQQQQQS